ncbi:aminotransferase class V-fold PLP-dependent enzyme [Candidatus Latescibacterota bacterium]
MALNVERIREDFPVYQRRLKGKPVIYMDSACITFCPRQVIDTVRRYYEGYPSCGGRSDHTFGREVARAIDLSRRAVQKFINAKNPREIIFTKNTTESINLIAHALPLRPGESVLTSDKEHNSCQLPFQLLKRKDINHKIFRFGDLEDFHDKLTGDVRLVSVVHVSNFDGTSNPIGEIITSAHNNGSLVLIDGAQSVPHRGIDVRRLDADFLAFSGHKMLGPSATGVLYGKHNLLERLDPFIVGGDTVINTTYDSYEREKIPERFEAGLQNYAGIVGLTESVAYLNRVGLKNIEKHERKLNAYITAEFEKLGIDIMGDQDPAKRGGIISFTIQGIDHHEVAGILNESANIMIRSGMHCVHSWCNAHNVKGSIRISLYLYNTEEECEILVEQIKKICRLR